MRTPQVVSFFYDRITLYGGEHSYIPVQGVVELQTKGTKFSALLGGGLGVGWWNVKETSGLISGHIGLSYSLNERLQVLTKAKYLSGTIINPMADASNGFNSFNTSVGINYQFINKK